MKKILVIAAHPDDEILGCGATMAKHIECGDQVKVIIAAEGLTSRSEKRTCDNFKDELARLKDTSYKANAILGVKDVIFLNFPDNRMDSVDLLDVIKPIEKVLDDYKPDIIYTHYVNDLNVDHKIVSQATLTACRPMAGSNISCVKFFEVPSSTEWNFDSSSCAFHPNCFNNVGKQFLKKIEALLVYKSEMRDWPHPRSIEAVTTLAKWRGACVGYEKSEAFCLGYNKE